MEKRIGSVLILIKNHESVQQMNDIISQHASIIIGRQGLSRLNGTSVMSLILEGTTDEIGSLSGKLGRLTGIEVKSVVLKNKYNENQ